MLRATTTSEESSDKSFHFSASQQKIVFLALTKRLFYLAKVAIFHFARARQFQHMEVPAAAKL
jgi:hypothetical protein